MVCSTVGLIGLMDRGFGLVIAKLGKASIPGQAWNFFRFFFNRLGCSFHYEDMFTFISLLCYMIVGHCCHRSVTRTSFHFHWRLALSLVNFKNYMYNFVFVFTWKLARGDRPHIFTGVKPLKTFYSLLQWGELFQGSYTLKFERKKFDTARYSLCSAGENCVRTAKPLQRTTDNLFSSVKPEYPAF